jgi:hypothetical protein
MAEIITLSPCATAKPALVGSCCRCIFAAADFPAESFFQSFETGNSLDAETGNRPKLSNTPKQANKRGNKMKQTYKKQKITDIEGNIKKQTFMETKRKRNTRI